MGAQAPDSPAVKHCTGENLVLNLGWRSIASDIARILAKNPAFRLIFPLEFTCMGSI